MSSQSGQLRIERLLSGNTGPAVRAIIQKVETHFGAVVKDSPGLPLRLLARVFLAQLRRSQKKNGSSIYGSEFEHKMQYAKPLGPKRKRGRPRGSFKKLPVLSISSLAANLPFRGVTALRPRHLRILNLYILGSHKVLEIALLCNVTTATVRNVVNSPLGARYIDNHALEARNEVRSLIRPAVDVFRSILTSKNAELAQKTAHTILKSEGAIKDVSRHQHEHTGPDGGAIEVVEMKKRLLKLSGVASDVIDKVEFTEVD